SFQAEAGIRGDLVTGVQTCTLPISWRPEAAARRCRCAHGRCGGKVARDARPALEAGAGQAGAGGHAPRSPGPVGLVRPGKLRRVEGDGVMEEWRLTVDMSDQPGELQELLAGVELDVGSEE